MSYRILAVDDESENLIATKVLLEQWGFEVVTCLNATEAMREIQSPFSDFAVALLDFRMPEVNGSELAIKIRHINDQIVILMYSGDDSREALKDTIKAGAVDFIEKSEDVKCLKLALESATKKFEETTRRLKYKAPQSDGEKLLLALGLVGVSTGMMEVAAKVHRYRSNRKSVLILGETGTGKEMIARGLHIGPEDKMVAINCAAFSDNANLLESELCGHEKGAFTGADQRKIGILEKVRGGTVFFDELHRLNLDAQGKLLRIFQEKKIRRVGGTEEYKVDFRIVAGTQPHLEQLMKEGKFLPDLYYRLNFLNIEVPSLRDRKEDIAPLVAHFCERYAKESGKSKSFLMRTVRCLERYSWPGNVRELEACVEQLLEDSQEKMVIDPKLLDDRFSDQSEDGHISSFEELEERHQKEKLDFILATLKTSDSKAHAAERLGMPVTTLKSLLKRMGISEAAS